MPDVAASVAVARGIPIARFTFRLRWLFRGRLASFAPNYKREEIKLRGAAAWKTVGLNKGGFRI